MKLLYTLIILFAFFMGCESWGVYSHNHESNESGACFDEFVWCNGGTCDEGDVYHHEIRCWVEIVDGRCAAAGSRVVTDVSVSTRLFRSLGSTSRFAR